MIDIRKNWHNIVFAFSGIAVSYNIFRLSKMVVENENFLWVSSLIFFFAIFGIVNGVLAFIKYKE